MKAIQVIDSVNNMSAGPSYTVPALCQGLTDQGLEVALHTFEPVPINNSSHEYSVQSYRRARFLPQAIGYSSKFRAGLNSAAENAQIVHVHGLWQMPGIYAAGTCLKTEGPKLVISPRGMLSKWALNYSKIKKKIFWEVFQRKALLSAHCFHATSEMELDEIRSVGLKSPIAIVPNGITIPTISDCSERTKTILFLARIHPKKGLSFLLKAWSVLQEEFPDWSIVVAGPDNTGHLHEMRRYANNLGLRNVRFVGPVFGLEKLNLLRQSSLYVLPTHSENFGMTIAEALAAAIPCIVTKGAPWRGLDDHHCGWWIDLDQDLLTQTMRRAMILSPDDRKTMGHNGRDWMIREFSWTRTAFNMRAVYEWLVSGKAQPEFVCSK